MSVGAELATARRTLDLSLDEVSSRTKISVERLSAIEQMDATQLPSLVYLKGFLRAYAAEVQLDPDDVAQRYLSEVDIAPSDQSVVASEPATPFAVAEHPLEKADDWQAEFASENSLTPEPPVAASERETRVAAPGKYFAVVDTNDLSSSAALSRSSSTRYLLGAIVLAIAAAAGWAISANFDTIAGRSNEARVLPPEAPRDAATSPTDADRSAAPEPVPAAPAAGPSPGKVESTAKTDAAPVKETGGSEPAARRGPTEPTTGSGKKAPTPGAASAPAASTAIGSTAEAGAAAATKSDVGDSPNVSGSWTLTNRVESSSYEEFQNLNLGFQLQLQQSGNRVSGKGQKWMENGRAIPPRSRTAITVEGTLTGRRLELNFTERGAQRTSAGTFVLDVADDGTLRGTFASDAAKSQGTSLARRTGSPNRE